MELHGCWETAFEHAPNALATLDKDMRILRGNMRLTRVLNAGQRALPGAACRVAPSDGVA